MTNKQYTDDQLLDNLIKVTKAAKCFEIDCIDTHLAAMTLIITELKQRNKLAKQVELNRC